MLYTRLRYSSAHKSLLGSFEKLLFDPRELILCSFLARWGGTPGGGGAAVWLTSICTALVRRVFEWPAVGSISIEQGVAGFGQTGQVVWNAGALLAEHMATRLGPSFFAGKRVLELGCGTGLPGIVAARLGASKLVLTDGTKEVIARAELNAAANLKGMPVAVSSMQLNWGEVTGKELGTFDVLLASDVLYQAAGWRPFAQTAGELLAPNGVVLVAEAGHQTSPADDTLRGFRVVAEGCGLACEDPETLAQQGESGYNAQLMRVWGRS